MNKAWLIMLAAAGVLAALMAWQMTRPAPVKVDSVTAITPVPGASMVAISDNGDQLTTSLSGASAIANKHY